MQMRSGGQASAEALVAIGILLVLAAAVGVFAFQRNSEAQEISEIGNGRQECERVSSIIYSLSSSDAMASMSMHTDMNIRIVGGLVLVGEYYCEHLGAAMDANLHSGTINISKNSLGVVVFAQG